MAGFVISSDNAAAAGIWYGIHAMVRANKERGQERHDASKRRFR